MTNMERIGKATVILIKGASYVVAGLMAWGAIGLLWKPLMYIAPGLAVLVFFLWLAWERAND